MTRVEESELNRDSAGSKQQITESRKNFSPLMPKRVDNLNKREPMEVRIPSTDLSDSMLAHKYGGMSVVQQIACEIGKLSDHLLCDHRVSLRGYEDAKAGRSNQRCDEFPRFCNIPRPSHDFRVCGHAKKFVKDRPRRIPGISAAALAFEPFAARRMRRRVTIGRVYQDVGIDDQHYRPSMAWYRASRSATSTNVPPLWNLGRGGRSCRFFCDRNSMRSAVSTRSDIVRPWRAASRLSCAITVSSMLRVVFIWKTIQCIWLDVKEPQKAFRVRVS